MYSERRSEGGFHFANYCTIYLLVDVQQQGWAYGDHVVKKSASGEHIVTELESWEHVIIQPTPMSWNHVCKTYFDLDKL